MPLILDNEAATLVLGKKLAEALRPGDKIALTGTLGAGKTTLARGILRGLGFGDDVPSPTFAIVQQYDPPEVRLPVAHVDFYRIEEPDEVQELGLDDILMDGAMIAEWPDRMPASFWSDALQLTLEIENDDTRQLTWTAGPAWKDRWPIT
ncbi:MAG: tRNA (adenosine(37)-N6)-threonylcarbamoyltransferase complex ATPase subunit type 1 TsaE [Parasphingorhabdus sp.]